MATNAPMVRTLLSIFFFFFNDTATTEIYTLSLHDALPICDALFQGLLDGSIEAIGTDHSPHTREEKLNDDIRSEEHTSELQSPCNLVCRLLLEKKKKDDSDAAIHAVCSFHSPAILQRIRPA